MFGDMLAQGSEINRRQSIPLCQQQQCHQVSYLRLLALLWGWCYCPHFPNPSRLPPAECQFGLQASRLFHPSMPPSPRDSWQTGPCLEQGVVAVHGEDSPGHLLPYGGPGVSLFSISMQSHYPGSISTAHAPGSLPDSPRVH